MRKILVADDKLPVRKLLIKIILSLGRHKIFKAESGEFPVNIYRKNIPDLVIMDMRMDVMSGIEASLKILEFNNKAKIIIVLSLADPDIIRECYSIGILDYIKKPFMIEEITAVVSNILGQRISRRITGNNLVIV